ncbi:MAG TPA: DUF1330 domain-containing protein [Xanthobacteraceae bacterium]|nr:DUF1330 domain-containing protein [Xanthobacteraceae bacterium]
MPKGYWVATADVTNMDGWRGYMEANAAAFRKYNGKFLVRGGKNDPVEGKLRSRFVVIEFPDYDTALACYHSPEYQKAKVVRLPHGTMDVAVVEGYEGAQP